MKTGERKIKKVEESNASREVDNTRGSNLWSFNHFRIRILTSLLNDLIDVENEGLCNEDVCLKIQTSLDYFINAATEIPKGGFLGGGPLYLEIESFKVTYIKWNGVEGGTQLHKIERQKLLRQLRKKRQIISNKARKIQYLIENNLDQILLKDAYRAIGEMINMVPSIFINLSSSYKDYKKIVGS